MSTGKSMEEILSEARRKARERLGLREEPRFVPGEVLLGTYQILSVPINGGLGSVWRVRHNQWNTDLAMKRPQAAYFRTDREKANFVRECEVWIELGLHPNIVSCYYVREISGVPTIFSEWMDGGSLRDWIRDESIYKDNPGNVAERVLSIAIQTARGLHFAHKHGLIHQDVKPDNVLLSRENGRIQAKIGDFGLSRARAQMTVLEGEDTFSENLTVITANGGYTPAYCSMEQLNGEMLSRRTDIYSWAVTVLEMYLGERLWSSGPIAGECCEDYFPLCRVPVCEELRILLKACLSENPAERPHDFGEILDRLLFIYHEQEGRLFYDEDPDAPAGELSFTASDLNNRALSYLDMGKIDRALETWREALRMDIANEELIVNYALAQWRYGRISLEGALEFLRFIPDEKRYEELSSLFEAEGNVNWSLNIPEDSEHLTPCEDLILAPPELLPEDSASLRSAIPSLKGDYAVAVKWNRVFLLRRGEKHGEIVREYSTFERTFYPRWAVFLSEPRYILALAEKNNSAAQYILIWDATTAQLLKATFIEENPEPSCLRCMGSFWRSNPSGSCRVEKAAEYRLSRAESVAERQRTRREAESCLSRAVVAAERDRLTEALSLLDAASAYPGYGNSLRIAALRERYTEGLPRRSVRNLIVLDTVLQKPEEKRHFYPTDEHNRLVSSQLESYRSELLDYYDGDPYSEYESEVKKYCASPDGKRNVYSILVRELRDSPAQSDTEVSEWTSLIVFDENGKCLFKKNGWYYIYYPNGAAPHRCMLSSDGNYLFYSGEGFYLANLRTGEEKCLQKGRSGPMGFSPDSRWFYTLTDMNELKVYETGKAALVYQRTFPGGLCTDLVFPEQGFPVLCIDGCYRPFSLLWDYDLM